MVNAYILGWLPNRFISYHKKNINLLIEIENCEDSINDFGRDVFNKDCAQYMTNKFKVIRIIDELCNEYTIAEIVINTNENHIQHITIELHEIIICPLTFKQFFITCYLTKKIALPTYLINKKSYYSYYKNGEIHEKINVDEKNTIINNRDFDISKHKSILYILKYQFISCGIYKEWSQNGELIQHLVYDNGNIKSDLIYDVWVPNELDNRFTVYNIENKNFFCNEFKKLLHMISIANNSMDKIKYALFVFKYLNTIVGLKIITDNEKFRKTTFDKINEIKNEDVIEENLKKPHDDEKYIKTNELLVTMKIIENYLNLIN
jgi:hypothetical protein